MSPRPLWRLFATLLVAIGARAFAVPIGEIACGETQVHVLGSQPDEIVFFSRPGEVVGASVAAAVPASGFEPRWRIADVEGQPVGLSSGDHRCSGRCTTAPLPSGGVFTLRIADSGRGRGAYVVSFEALSGTANGLSNGPPAPACMRLLSGLLEGTLPVLDDLPIIGSIALPGETDTHAIDVQAGEAVHVDLVRTGGDGAFSPVWIAFDASGKPVTRAGDDQTVPLAASGVVTILVADLRVAVGTYTLVITRVPPYPTTTTTSTSSTTTVVAETTTTTTTTTAAPTTSAPPTSTTSTTAAGPTTTATVTTTTTTLAPVVDLDAVIQAPVVGPGAGLGSALAATAERLVIGVPHADAGAGASRIRRAGVALVVDVGGLVGSPGFGHVVARLLAPSPTEDGAFGAAVAVAAPAILVGAPGARRAVFFDDPADPAPLVIEAPVSDVGDAFGAAVAIADDLLVVGAPLAADGAGAAYVFEPGTAAPHPVLEPPADSQAVRFGAALATSGALVLVGAPGDDTHPGRAFLFEAATGALRQSFAAEQPAAGDGFGAALGFDVGGVSVIIGAPGALGARGRVARFEVASGRETLAFDRPGAVPGERFGAALALGDGRVVAGAPRGMYASVPGGVAFTFDAASATPEGTLHRTLPEPADAFGAAVAAAGGRVFVGVPGDDSGTTNGGNVYVYEAGALVAAFRERLSNESFGAAVFGSGAQLFAGAPEGGSDGRGWIARVDPNSLEADAVIMPPDLRARRFGASLASLGATIAVGAPETDRDVGVRAGAVYLYDGPVLQATLEHPDPGPGDEFGFAVGRLGGDVLASAPFAGEGDTGRVYRLAPGSGKLRVTYAKAAPTSGDFFGAAVAGDAGQVLVGAPLDAAGGAPAGAAYLFDGDSAAIVRTFPNPSGSADLFGAAVSLGAWIVVGAPLADGATVGGAVYVFDRATGSIVRRIDNPPRHAGDAFGASIAVFDGLLVVGAPFADEDGGGDVGRVYLFEADTGVLRQTLRDPRQGAFDEFGFALSGGGTDLFVGSPGTSSVYLFDLIDAAALVRPRAAGAPFAPRGSEGAAVCRNGLVEGAEACDDGNEVDADDCRNDCTAGPCCTLDAVSDAVARCDDGNPCTTDSVDEAIGCRYAPSGAAGCCTGDADCPEGQCRVCLGCFIYEWDCCAAGSRCVPSNPECEAETCVDAAYCQCGGKLDCGEEAVPEALRVVFDGACDTLRLQTSVAPTETPTTEDLALARQRTKSARGALRKAIRTARALAREGTITRTCRQQAIQQTRVVKRAIPRGKKLRRCVLGGG